MFGTKRQNSFHRKSWYPSPLFFLTFSVPESFWNTEGFLDEIFRHSETKIFRRKVLILPLPSYSYPFLLPGIFWNTAQKGSRAKFFGTARQKNSTKNCDITLLSIKFFDTRNQWHPKGFPYESFRHCETKNFRRKILILPPPSYP